MPSSDSTEMFSEGPKRPTNFFEITSPNPTPYLFILPRLKVAYCWNSFATISLGIPIPVSLTMNNNNWSSICIFRVILPVKVNFNELLRRLIRIYLRRFWSVYNSIASIKLILTNSSSNFFIYVCLSKILLIESRQSSRKKDSIYKRKDPCLIWL